MLSNKAKYGLQALMGLARQWKEGGVIGIGELAKREQIPQKFLELILLDLKNIGLLHSKRGPGGGYSLARPPDKINLGDVIRELDGPLAPVPCVSKNAYKPCPECQDEATCGIRLVMQEVRDAIAGILEHTTLEDMVNRADAAKEPSDVPMYYI